MEPKNDERAPVPTEELGHFLRLLRQKRCRTQEETARVAAISRRTLLRWEAGEAQPRVPEMHGLLTALSATQAERQHALQLMEAPRARRALRETPPTPARGGGEPGPGVSVGGDLLRAMRLRQHRALEQVAAELHVTPSTLSRWERGDVIPADEILRRLLTLLGADVRERAALTQKGLWRAEPPRVPVPATAAHITELEADWQRLCDVVYDDPKDALLDLRFLSLEARLEGVAEHPSGRELLARVLAHHANHLLVFYRYQEARRYSRRALTLSESLAGTTRDGTALRAGIVAAEAIAAPGSRSAVQRGLDVLRQFQPYAKLPEYNAWVRANEAKYLLTLGYPADAVAQADQACQTVLHCDDSVELVLRQRDLAQLYLHWGRPDAAFPLIHEWDPTSPIERAMASLLRAQALHALRDSGAAAHLSAALSDITAHNLRHLQPQADRLAKLLQ